MIDFRAAFNFIERIASWTWRKGRTLAPTVVVILATAWATASLQESERTKTSRSVAAQWHAALVIELERTRHSLQENKEILESALPKLRQQIQALNAGENPAIVQLSLPYESLPISVWEQLQSPLLAVHLPVDWYLDVAVLYEKIQLYAEIKQDIRTQFRSLLLLTGGGVQRREQRVYVTHELLGHVELALAFVPNLDSAIAKIIEQTKANPL